MTNSNKRIPLIIAVIVIVIAAIAYLALKGPKAPETHTVTSPDGSASLEIPVNALPEGVELSDVSVALTESILPEPEDEDGTASVTYTLAPDGLEFVEPIRFSATVDNPALTLPVAYITSGETLARIPEKDIDIDATTGKTVIGFPLDHFSEVTIKMKYSNTKATFSVSGTVSDTPVGQEVPAQAVVTVNHGASRSVTHKYPEMTFTWTYSLVPDSTKLSYWHLDPDWSHLEISTPSSGSPKERAFTDSITLPIEGEGARYGCKKAGPSWLDFMIVLKWDEKVTNEHGAEVRDIYHEGCCVDKVTVHNTFECTVEEAKAWQAFAVLLTGDFKHFSGFSEVNGTVSVVANDPVPVPDATVTLKMTPKYGEPETTEVVTGTDGKADYKFTIYSYGDYTVSIEDIAGENLEYHPELNEVSSTEVKVR
jgi:hypothetical protein